MPRTPTLYSLRDDGDQFRVTKFDADLNIESSYLMTATECTCPAGVRPTCRHRQMFPDLLPRVNTSWLWNFDARVWIAGPAETLTPGELDLDDNIELAEAEAEADELAVETGACGAPSQANIDPPLEPEILVSKPKALTSSDVRTAFQSWRRI